MPDPEDKVIEHGKGVFVTAAMLNQLHEDATIYPGKVSYKEEKEPTLADVVERLDRLEGLIKLTFDGHVLINGRFRKITP